MFNENIESRQFQIDPEKAGKPDKVNEREVLQHVESLLEKQTNQIGKGRTAEVHFVETNDKICYKIICRSEHFSTIQKSSKDSPGSMYHPLPVEAEYLESLQDIRSDVRVPRPLYTIERHRTGEEVDAINEERLSILAMERLNAVSVRDVLEDKEPLPQAFNKQRFFEKLRDFFERMHEKSIHHRDAHDGNIMIDRETGEPYLIDFGSAAYGTDEDVYRDDYPGGKRIVYIKDVDNIEKVERLLNLKGGLTKTT